MDRLFADLFANPRRRPRMTAREEDLYYARISPPDLSRVRVVPLSGIAAICVLVLAVALL